MKRIFNFFLAVTFVLILTSCAGTGTKIKPTISSSENTGSTNLYFARGGGFVAGGVLAKVEVNGTEIARLGVKEFTQYSVNGNYNIKVSGAGLGGLGMGSDSTSGVGDGKNYFYIISVKQGLLSAKFIINETTETGYNQAQ